MTITTSTSETYVQHLDPAAVATDPQADVESVNRSWPSMSNLFWAGISLFAANVVVLGSLSMTPELRVGVYGEDAPAVSSSSGKPSPFTEVVDTGRPRKAKLAQHVTPVLYQEPVMADMSAAPAELAVPRASQAAAAAAGSAAAPTRTVSGDAVYRQVESYGEFRRVTAMSQDLMPSAARRVAN